MNMTNPKDETKNQIDTIIKEGTEKFCGQVKHNFNEFNETTKEMVEKSFDTTNSFIQDMMISALQSFSKYVIDFQSGFSEYLDIYNKSNWNNFRFPERQIDVYNKTTEIITDNTVKIMLGSTETVTRSMEIAQKRYNEPVQKYFNFVNCIGKSFSNQ